MGAGDGGYAFHRARSDPSAFAIAIDADADALAEGAWRARRRRLANIAFLVEGVERLPHALCRVADEVTVHFPWGSLLRGLAAADAAVLAPLATLMRPSAELRMLVSATWRDGHPPLSPGTFSALASAYRCFGLAPIEVRAAMRADVAASRSSWAKRLGPTRPVVLARYVRLSA